MVYKIVQIEGIGPVYAEKLEAAGVKTTLMLLQRASTPAGRKKLAEETDIPEKHILKWANHADLMRVKGIGGQYAELLEASGVDTIKELRHRVAANLQPKMMEVNEAKHLCGRVPTLVEVERMIDRAKQLSPMLKY